MSKIDKKIVIGLDYGTTYTGVAWGDSTASFKDLQLITNWPGSYSNNATNEKVPSQLAYGDFPHDEYHYSWGTWGNLIPTHVNGVDRQYWTKLALDKNDKKSRELRMLIALLSNDMTGLNLGDDDDEDDGPPAYPGKEPKDIVADYLSGVKDHVFRQLREDLGPVLFDTCEIEVVVTVPAVWSDKAKDLTFQAVTKAGFVGHKDSIKMITEPEAAATYTLKILRSGAGGDDFHKGDHFILCDGGGGTVDLLSYKVSSVHPEFRVEEAAVGSGDKCGSTFIDRAFWKWLATKLGEEAFKKIPSAKRGPGSRLSREFEAIKTSFTGAAGKFYVAIPTEAGVRGDPSKVNDDGEMQITTTDLMEMFDSCVDRTLELIDEQAAAIVATGNTVKFVFLVGGFGRSEYLYKRVQEYCKDRGFGVRRPPNPWSAIVRGAVARGLEPNGGGLVELRKCRLHYGTPVSQKFIPGKHSESDSYIDELTGEKYAKGQMRWLFQKGDALPVNKPKRAAIECSVQFKLDETRTCGAQLAICREDDAPLRYMDNAVAPLCTVRADLSTIPLSKFTRARARRGGAEFLVASFSIELVVDNSQLKFFLMFEGEEYGSAVPNFEG